MTSRPSSAAMSRRNNAAPSAATKQSRPRSVLLKHPSEETVTESSRPITPPSKLSKTYEMEGGKSNIQVVVRCRRRSEKEIQEGSPVIVATSGPQGQEVTIETGSSISSFGVVTLPPTRSYPFDCVFGPEADQNLIYNQVVAPLLDQVLMGYNCTLFAYGQTGTGKTYTMQGDLTLTRLGNPSPSAGMTPRVLIKLFQYLEKNIADYSVKLSFVELYNEELRDLLAPDSSQSTQQNSNSTSLQGQQANQLKLFDDNSKKGVLIQGLEEFPVKNAADAIALLTRGSQKRQIAATKFNDHSSRSHSIFSITVHSKEASSLGDDLLRVGKLYLVDLAGSENIGRSGAENKRAREAGMINQSLLTLGRVINALVDKSPHVPYRESKLTRLLQDSLGGRTKTTIIATISPVKSNLEETLSTLEYALRAKSIRNKPEVNQRLTKNALLKEYVAEIERLKADLISAREMNGIYFSQDSWNQMWTENEERQALYEETKRQISSTEAEMRAVREEFEQTVALLVKHENELAETRETLKTTEHHLKSTSNTLDHTCHQLQEETIVRKAHQDSEENLNKVAGHLKSSLDQTTADIDGLYAKLHRKSVAVEANAQTVSSYGKTLQRGFTDLNVGLQEFATNRETIGADLGNILQHFLTTQKQMIESQANTTDEEVHSLKAFLMTVRTNEDTIDTAMNSLYTTVQAVNTKMLESFNIWSRDFVSQLVGFHKEYQMSGSTVTEQMNRSMVSLVETLNKIVLEAGKYSQEKHELFLDMRKLITENCNSEMQFLKSQNKTLSQLLQLERTKTERARSDLVQRISGLLGEFVEERDRDLKEVIGEIQNNASQREAAVLASLKTSDSNSQTSSDIHINWQNSLNQCQRDGLRSYETFEKASSILADAFGTGLTKFQEQLTTVVSCGVADMKKHARDISLNGEEAFDQIRQAKRIKTEVSDAFQIDSQRRMESLRTGWSVLSEKLNHELCLLQDKIGEDDAATVLLIDETMMRLTQMKINLQELLSKGTRSDESTGFTPVKKVWLYPKDWSTAGSRQNILNQYKQITPSRSLETEHDISHHVESSNLNVQNAQTEAMEQEKKISKEDAFDEVLPADSELHKISPERLEPLREQPVNVPIKRSSRLRRR